jgi:putative glutamine amidotransferase
MPRPLIGITLDSEAPGGYSKFPWYALRRNYCDAVADAGGIPVLLPHGGDGPAYAERIHGLVVSGGDFDVDPALFGDAAKHPTVKTKDGRTDFEIDVTRAALGRNLPVLGICGGQQLLNVILGGTLIQHIPDTVVDALAHEQPNPRNEPGHPVRIMADTLLHKVVGALDLAVNSAHHQAAREVGPGVIVDALAPDGVIEGIEDPRYRFCLGVQWHPEFVLSEGDRRLFAAFVDAAR